MRDAELCTERLTNTAEVSVRRADVYSEAAKITEYAGAALSGEGAAEARERLLLTEAAWGDLSRVWAEACAAADATLSEWIGSPDGVEFPAGGDEWRRVLRLGSFFDGALRQSAESALRSYFVYSVLSDWFGLQGSDSAAVCAAKASAFMDAAQRLLRGRRKHARVRQHWL